MAATDGSFYMNDGSLMDLAFEGQQTAEDDARIVEMSNPELFNQGIIEHARYLGMDPDVDEKYLWIAKESLIAPVPEGWTQEATHTGAPYYYNHKTGESRWEHPSDEEYTQLFQDEKRKDSEQNGWHSSRSEPGYSQPHTDHWDTTTYDHNATWVQGTTHETHDQWEDLDQHEQTHDYTDADLQPATDFQEKIIKLDRKSVSRSAQADESRQVVGVVLGE